MLNASQKTVIFQGPHARATLTVCPSILAYFASLAVLEAAKSTPPSSGDPNLYLKAASSPFLRRWASQQSGGHSEERFRRWGPFWRPMAAAYVLSAAFPFQEERRGPSHHMQELRPEDTPPGRYTPRPNGGHGRFSAELVLYALLQSLLCLYLKSYCSKINVYSSPISTASVRGVWQLRPGRRSAATAA
jgi:hypothetical protein